MSAARPVGYRELIRTNRRFRYLWLATVVSLFGDWFNMIAVFALVEHLTGSPFAIGIVLAIKLLGLSVGSIPGGLLADRVSRKALMIGADLVRAALVVGFIFIDEVGELPLLYTLVAAQVGFGAVFDPAFRASIPNITAPRELLTANALFAATWSTLLALGAAVGGIATAALGLTAVFVIDALTYVISAWLIQRVDVPQTIAPRSAEDHRRSVWLVAARDVWAGWHYILARPAVMRAALAKTNWAFGGAALVYALTQIGEALTPGEMALGVGALFSVRGLGSGLGPILARVAFSNRRTWPTVLGASVLISGLAYLVVGAMGWTWWVLLPVTVAHAAGGANWVLSTVMLQERVEDAFRGRVFGSEVVVLTAVEAVMTLVAAALLEAQVLELQTLVYVCSAMMLASATVWLLWVPRAERSGSGAA